MAFVDLLALVLATGAPINGWFHRGGIFDYAREWVLAWSTDHPSRAAQLFGQLVRCRFCMHYHAPLWLLLLFYVPSLFLVAPWDAFVKLPIYALAATRASYWFSQLFTESDPNFAHPIDEE